MRPPAACYVGSEDWNLEPHADIASALPTESSPPITCVLRLGPNTVGSPGWHLTDDFASVFCVVGL